MSKVSSKLVALDSTLEKVCRDLRDQPNPIRVAYKLLDTAFSIVPSEQADVIRKVTAAKEGCEVLADIAWWARHTIDEPTTAELAEAVIKELSPQVALCIPLIS
jgi:hypothetical protein